METTSSSGSEHGMSIPTPPSLKSHNTPTIASTTAPAPRRTSSFWGPYFECGDGGVSLPLLCPGLLCREISPSVPDPHRGWSECYFGLDLSLLFLPLESLLKDPASENGLPLGSRQGSAERPW